MKIHKLATIVLLVATAIVGFTAFMSFSHAGGSGGNGGDGNHGADAGLGVWSGYTTIYYGQESTIPIDCRGKGMANNTVWNVYVDDGAMPPLGGVCVDGIVRVNLPLEYTYSNHTLQIRQWFNLDWGVEVQPWSVMAIVYFDPVVLDRRTENLSNVLVGRFEVNNGDPLADAHVGFFANDNTYFSTVTGSNGEVCFDFSNAPNGNYTGFLTWTGNESAAAVDSGNFTVEITESPVPVPPVPPVNPGDDNSTNDTNDTVDILKPLEDYLGDIGESLPVTGIPVDLLAILLVAVGCVFWFRK